VSAGHTELNSGVIRGRMNVGFIGKVSSFCWHVLTSIVISCAFECGNEPSGSTKCEGFLD